MGLVAASRGSEVPGERQHQPTRRAPAAWVADTAYDSDDISALVQGFIDRPGYTPGAYLGIGFTITPLTAPAAVRSFYSQDSGSTPAVLTVTYTPRPHYAARLLERTTAHQFVDASTAHRFAERMVGRQLTDSTTAHRFLEKTPGRRFLEGSEG